MDNANPHGDWGPGPNDIRHRLTGIFNVPIWKRLVWDRRSASPPRRRTTSRRLRRQRRYRAQRSSRGRRPEQRAGGWSGGRHGATELDVRLRPAAQTEGGPQVQIVRIAGDNIPAGGPVMGVAGNRTGAVRALRGVPELPQSHKPRGVQRRDDVAVLRRGDVRDAGAADRAWGPDRALTRPYPPPPHRILTERIPNPDEPSHHRSVTSSKRTGSKWDRLGLSDTRRCLGD